MKLNHLSYILSAVLFTVLVINALSLVFFTSHIRETVSHASQSVESVRASEELQIHLLNHGRESTLWILTGDPVHDSKRHDEEREIKRWISETKKYVSGQEEERLIREIEASSARFLKARISSEDRNRAAPELESTANVGLENADLEEALQAAQRLTDLNIAQAQEMQDEARWVDRMANIIGTATLLFSLLTFPLIWILLRTRVYNPIQNVYRAVTDYTQNQEEVRIPEAGAFEIQRISSAFNAFVVQLAEQKATRLRFLAGVAHDLRNPLGAIRMSADLLKEEDLSKDEQDPIIEVISRQATQLDRMVGDFLDASRIESGHLDVQKSRQDLRSLLEDAVLLHRPLSEIHRISLTANQSVYCQCDPVRISQVLNNLINNAIKYSPGGGNVDVSLEIEGNEAVVQVSDEGIGVSEEDRFNIFEPFQRTNLTKETIPGVGLGLSVSKKIVRAHNGSITVHSTPGRGSTFTVRIPLQPHESTRASRPIEPHA